MLQIGLIGLAAGAAAALLFASVASGAWLSVAMFYLAPLPILIAALGWSHWAALIAALVRRAGAGGCLRLGVLLCISRRRRRSRLVARLSRHARAPDNERRRSRRHGGARMVSAGAAGDLGGNRRRAGGDRGDPQFRQRRGKLPRRPAQRADAHSARGNRHRGGRAALGARRQECQQAGRFPGDRRAAGSRGRRHNHQPGQSVACRPHREGLRTAQAAVAATFQHDVSHAGCRAARCRRDLEFFRRPELASWPACCRRAC